jgi:hypothetical protein
MSISGKFVNFRGVSVTIGGVTHARFREQVDELDKSSGASAGFVDRDAGLKSVTIDFGGWIDVAAGAFPGGIASGSELVNANLPVGSGGANILVTLPSALVLSFEAGGETRGRLEFNASVVNKGTYTLGST